MNYKKYKINKNIYIYIFLFILLIIFYNYYLSNKKKKELFTNINELYQVNFDNKKNKSNLSSNINDYTNIFTANPFVYFLSNNNDIQINKVHQYIQYNDLNISARRNDPIHYSIYNKKLNKLYEIWRYPDFINEKKRHSKFYMDQYINFFYKKYIDNNKNNIFEFTSYHGILDNKVRLWIQLVNKYGRNIASNVMPNTYLIPDDKKIFYQDYLHKKKNSKFVLKNSFMGGKSGIKITNSYQEIIDIFNKYENSSIYSCEDNVCLGNRDFNLVQPYLDNPFLINGYKFNFRFYLVIFWKNNKMTAGVFKEFYLSYATNKFNKESNNFTEIITSYSDNSNNSKWDTVDKITIETKRPNSYKTFKKYLEENNLDFNVFLEKLLLNINKIIESNKEDLISYCLPNQNHFQIYALDMEMEKNLNTILYEANLYFILYKHLYGKLQASMYEDIFHYFEMTNSYNNGFWNVFPI